MEIEIELSYLKTSVRNRKLMLTKQTNSRKISIPEDLFDLGTGDSRKLTTLLNVVEDEAVNVTQQQHSRARVENLIDGSSSPSREGQRLDDLILQRLDEHRVGAVKDGKAVTGDPEGRQTGTSLRLSRARG